MNKTTVFDIYKRILTLLLAVFACFMCACAFVEEPQGGRDSVVVPSATHKPMPTVAPTAEPTPNITPEPTVEPTPEVTVDPMNAGSVGTPGDMVPFEGEKLIALTFDDGPYGTVTNRILDVVEKYAEHGVHVTFFALGSQVDKYPNTVKRAVQLGCEIGNHTYDHKNLTKISEDEIKNQIQSGVNAIDNACGKRPRLVRPPYGAKNDTVYATVPNPLILWSIDTLDWKTRDADSTFEETLKAKDGDIVLMHDVRECTADAVERIIPALLEQGYKLVTVSEMFEAKGLKLSSGKAYRQAK